MFYSARHPRTSANLDAIETENSRRRPWLHRVHALAVVLVERCRCELAAGAGVCEASQSLLPASFQSCGGDRLLADERPGICPDAPWGGQDHVERGATTLFAPRFTARFPHFIALYAPDFVTAEIARFAAAD